MVEPVLSVGLSSTIDHHREVYGGCVPGDSVLVNTVRLPSDPLVVKNDPKVPPIVKQRDTSTSIPNMTGVGVPSGDLVTENKNEETRKTVQKRRRRKKKVKKVKQVPVLSVECPSTCRCNRQNSNSTNIANLPGLSGIHSCCSCEQGCMLLTILVTAFT